MNHARRVEGLLPAGAAEEATGELVMWMHLWFGSAVHTLRALDDAWDDDDPVGSIGARDAFTLVLVDAIRNVARGAVACLGSDHPAVLDFDESTPTLKRLRDRLEHYDEYVLGLGRAQGANMDSVSPPMRFTGSSGGSSRGHTVTIAVDETSGQETYSFETAAVVDATRDLVLSVLKAAGRDDEQHRRRCWLCRPDLAEG